MFSSKMGHSGACMRRVNYGEGLRDGESVSEKGCVSGLSLDRS